MIASSNGVPSYTWASKPSGGIAGQSIIFVSDVGENGSYFYWTGSKWRVVGGVSVLRNKQGSDSGINNVTEVIVLQALLPAGAWQQYDTLRIYVTANKSGATNTCNCSVHIGTAGTVADTALTGLSNFVLLPAASVAGGFIFDVKLMGATSAQKIGGNTANGHSYGAGSTSEAAATAITSASANALYVSVGLFSSGATDTVGCTGGQIELHA